LFGLVPVLQYPLKDGPGDLKNDLEAHPYQALTRIGIAAAPLMGSVTGDL